MPSLTPIFQPSTITTGRSPLFYCKVISFFICCDQKFDQKVDAEQGESPCNLKRKNTMSLETTAPKPKNISRMAALGMIIGSGIALLLSELGLEMEMSVGFVLGLCIGAAIDKRKKEERV